MGWTDIPGYMIRHLAALNTTLFGYIRDNQNYLKSLESGILKNRILMNNIATFLDSKLLLVNGVAGDESWLTMNDGHNQSDGDLRIRIHGDMTELAVRGYFKITEVGGTITNRKCRVSLGSGGTWKHTDSFDMVDDDDWHFYTLGVINSSVYSAGFLIVRVQMQAKIDAGDQASFYFAGLHIYVKDVA